MVSRPLNADVLPALEPLPVDSVAVRRRAYGFGSWAVGAFVLDGLMLLAAAVVAQLARRGLYDWRLRLSVLDNLRRVVSATALAAMVVLCLRLVLHGDVHDLTSQSLRMLAFSAVFVAAGRAAFDWTQLMAR